MEFRRILEDWENLEGAEKRAMRHVPLVIFNKAKQAAIDLRLLDPTNKDCAESKVNQCIREAVKIYKRTGNVQMIFCDLYRSPEPKEEWLDEDRIIPNPAYGLPRFNLFNDIKKKLIAQGVKDKEIAILTEPKYDKLEKLIELLDKANKGQVKFLMGTTERLGIGINAQKRLGGLHHLDAPNRPMDYTQRNRRILRQGNLNKVVSILSYGVKKTLDSAAFQRLATKQRFINQIMKGSNLERVTEDAADESQMTFDEMMACLSDSPYAQQKLLVDNRLKSELLKRDNFKAKMHQTERQLKYTSDDIEKLKVEYEMESQLSESTKVHFPASEITEVTISGEVFKEGLEVEVDKYIESLVNIYRESATLKAIGHILVNGVKVNIHIDNEERYNKKLHRNVNIASMYYNVPELGVHPSLYSNGSHVRSNSGFGLMTSLRWNIDSALTGHLKTKVKIDKLITAYEELKRNVGSEFDETKLNALQSELEVLSAKMQEEKSEQRKETVLN